MTECPALVSSWGRVFILYLDVSALVKKIGVVFFLVFIMGVFMVSAEESGLVVGSTTEAGSGEKSPDNPYKIEGYAPDSVTVGDEVYGVPCEPLFGNGEFQDTYDPVTGVETRYWNLITFDGSEDWSLLTSEGYVDYVFFEIILGKQNGFQTSICSHFVNVDGAYNHGSPGMYSDSLYNSNVYFVSSCSTVDEFKAWLAVQYEAGTPVQLLYRLMQPVIVQHEPILIADSDLSPLYFSLQWVIQNVLTVIQIVALDPVLMLGISVWCFGGVVFLFRRLV